MPVHLVVASKIPMITQAEFLHCLPADANHQPIAKSLNEQDYNSVKSLKLHTDVLGNTYSQYEKMGFLCQAGISYHLIFRYWINPTIGTCSKDIYD